MTPTTMWFAQAHPLFRWAPCRSRRFWTAIGALTIPLWATWPALSLQTRALPPLECLALIFLIGWLESTVMPTLRSAAAIVVVGLVPTAIANWTWDQGLRKGDGRLLAVMAYGTPVCSALFLALLGLESLSWRIVLGAILIATAGMMSRAEEPRVDPPRRGAIAHR